MSNPFGGNSHVPSNPFGGQGTSGFGTTVQASVFGQVSKATTESTSSNLFVNPGISTSTSNSLFSSRQSPISSNVFGTGSFGKRSSPITTGTFGSTSFGKTTVPNVFGQGTNISAPSDFGPPSTTGKTMFENLTATSGSTLFGQSTKASSPSPFAQTAGSSSSTNLFGQQSSTSATAGTNMFAQAASTGSLLFGQTSVTSRSNSLGKSSSTTVASPNLFSGAVKSESNLFKPVSSAAEQAQVSPVFGQPISTSSPSFPNAFGKPFNSATGTLFGQTSGSTSAGGTSSSGINLFGKSSNDPNSFRQGSAQGSTSETRQSSSITTLFGKAVPASTSESFSGQVKSESSLFKQVGEPRGSSSMDPSKPLFGKHPASIGQRPAVEPSTSSFGVATKCEPKDGLKGGNAGIDDEEVAVQQDDANSEKPVAARGLFGKGIPIKKRLNSAVTEKDSPSSARPLIKRLTSQTARETNRETSTCIIARKVPAKFNYGRSLREHFGKFGVVKKVFPNPTKQQATIHFETHEAAAEAKRHGTMLARGLPPMTIFWSNFTSASPSLAGARKARLSSGSEDNGKRLSIKRLSTESGLPSSKRWSGSDNISEELSSMAGTQDLQQPESGVSVKGREPGKGLFKGRGRAVSKALPEKKARSPSPKPVASSVSGEKISAGHFQGVIAHSTADRKHLLELRDKYIRQNRGKRQTDIQKAKAFVGTCPDMCPERERYDREEKRCLSYYEIVPGTENIPGKNPQVDHHRAVKEFLRSTPDQDEPLPHELRPIPVLEATMVYLLQEVAERVEEGRLGDWFDFLWNRTRGIRKDIIQQQLNDQQAVGLIEKCARFHVYCSERLCEEDMHTFDAKINNENLTKCLQTLREFYADLEKKQKCFCENEAEFRAYTVLMNLNEGDILREVQKLRPEIRSTPPIKFALEAYFALNSSNYIRFFRLVKNASFGNACIMHRYFTQVRNKALMLMMRSYKLGSKPAQVSFCDLMRMLGFETETEASEFFQYYNLPVSDTDVTLLRSEYLDPEQAWSPRRAPTLIESKLMVSVGEFINGGAFDPSAGHILPASSFDQNGRFHSHVPLPNKAMYEAPGVPSRPAPVDVKPEISPVRFETRPDHAEPRNDAQETEPALTAAQLEQEKILMKQLQNECIKDTAKVLFWEVIGEIAHSVATETQADVTAKLHVADDILDVTLKDVLEGQLRDISEEVYDDCWHERRQAMLRDIEQRRERVAPLVTDDLVFDLVDQEVDQIAADEMREVKRELERQRKDRVTVEIADDIISAVVSELSTDTAEDVFETDVRQRLRLLADLQYQVELQRTKRFLSLWQQAYLDKTKRKRYMAEFPACPNLAPFKTKEILNVEDDSVRDKMFYISPHARLSIETPTEVVARQQRMELQDKAYSMCRSLQHAATWLPVDIAGIVHESLAANNVRQTGLRSAQPPGSSECYWKLLVCLPGVDDIEQKHHRTTHTLCHWLKHKLSCIKSPVPEKLQYNKSKVLSLYESRRRGKSSVGVCVRSVEGDLEDKDITVMGRERLFLGTSAVLMLLPAGATADRQSQYWEKQVSWLQSILSVRPMYQAFSLVIIVPVPANQELSNREVKNYLELEDRIAEELVGSVHIVTLETDSRYPEGINLMKKGTSEQLHGCVEWLVEHSSSPPQLSVSPLKVVVDGTLARYFNTPVLRQLQIRRQEGFMHPGPENVVDLYNSVVDHLVTSLTHDDLYNVSWPSPEFKSVGAALADSSGYPQVHWNRDDHLDYLNDLITSLVLPEWSAYTGDVQDWNAVKRHVWTYVERVGDKSTGDGVMLFSRVKKLLRDAGVDFERRCAAVAKVEGCCPGLDNMPWVDLLHLCIDYKLLLLDWTDPSTPDAQGHEREPLIVAYQQDLLEDFTVPAHWRQVQLDTDETAITLEESIERAVSRARDRHPRRSREIIVVEDPLNVSQVVKETRRSSSKLLNAVQSERRQSDIFQKFLENAIKDGDQDLGSNDRSSPLRDSFTENDRGASFLSVTSVFERGYNQTFGTESDMLADTSRRKSFDALRTLKRQQNDISAIFDDVHEGKSLIPSRRKEGRRKSDVAELSDMPSKKRRERLSEIFNNDPVLVYLHEPTLSEDVENVKFNIKSQRRASDLYEKRLRKLMENH